MLGLLPEFNELDHAYYREIVLTLSQGYIFIWDVNGSNGIDIRSVTDVKKFWQDFDNFRNRHHWILTAK